MKKILVLLISLVFVFTMTACEGNDSSGGNDSADMISVVIDIDFPDESGVADVDDIQIEVADGSSVMDAIKAYADANDGEILVDDSGDSPYITSINGVAATDAAGWVYEVNDEMVMESADKCTLKKGDKIDWSFEQWSDPDDTGDDD